MSARADERPSFAGAPPRPRPRVIGIGQPAAGDDGVGPAVIEEMRRSGSAGAELHAASDVTCLLTLLEHEGPVVLVDAVVDAGPPGRVRVLRPEHLDPAALCASSSHGMSVGQAVELARTLSPERVAQDIRVVAITIERPRPGVAELSPAARAAIAPAVEVVRGIVTQEPGDGGRAAHR